MNDECQPEDASPVVGPLVLDDIEPVLVESMSDLIDRFGAGGVRTVLGLLGEAETWPDAGSIDPHDYTAAECFVAGRLSTMPPFASEFSPRALPFARAALEAMGDWIPDE